MWTQAHSFQFEEVFHLVETGSWVGPTLVAAALLLFVGAMGKSAQFPLHVWLPDAMAGPTPGSALIHAATMVAAGVYLVARSFPLFEANPRDAAGRRARSARSPRCIARAHRARDERHQEGARVLDDLAARLHDARARAWAAGSRRSST